MSLLADRAGQVVVRVGGNTQDYATLVPNTTDGRILEKESIDPNNPVSLTCHLSLRHRSLLRPRPERQRLSSRMIFCT